GAQPDPCRQGQGKRRAARTAQAAVSDRRLFPVRPRLHHDRGAREALASRVVGVAPIFTLRSFLRKRGNSLRCLGSWVPAFAGTNRGLRQRRASLAIASKSAQLSVMTPGARLSAAIEVLADIDRRRRPAPDALKDWGLTHRFAGSGDRAAIAGLVYDALRRKASSAFVIGETSARAVVLGMLALERKLDLVSIACLVEDSRHAPGALSEPERARLAAPSLDGAPAWIAGDYPEWLDLHLARTFSDDRVAEGVALASRAPLDLRVNTLKGSRDEAAEALAHLRPQPTRWSPHGLRIMLPADAKSPAIHAEPAFLKGLIEVQDEGSQMAALCAGAKPGEHVVDLCAGAGGKTLALAATMEGRGQIYATDSDKRRLAPIH